MDQLVIDRGLTAITGLQPALDREHLRRGERGERQPGHIGLGLFPPRNNREHFFAIRTPNRTHISNTSSDI